MKEEIVIIKGLQVGVILLLIQILILKISTLIIIHWINQTVIVMHIKVLIQTPIIIDILLDIIFVIIILRILLILPLTIITIALETVTTLIVVTLLIIPIVVIIEEAL